MSRMELIDHLNAPLLHRCMRKAALCLPAAVGICDGHVESGGSKKPKHLRFGSSMCQPHKLNYPAFIKIDSSQQKYEIWTSRIECSSRITSKKITNFCSSFENRSYRAIDLTVPYRASPRHCQSGDKLNGQHWNGSVISCKQRHRCW